MLTGMLIQRRRFAFAAILTGLCLLWGLQGGGRGSALVASAQPQKKSAGKTYYVAPSGKDSARGTAAAPWQTLQYAVVKLKAGDTLVVRKGNYAGFYLEGSGAPDQPITIKAEAGASITSRNGETSDGINLENASYVTIEGFTLRNPGKSMTRAGIRAARGKGIVIRNNDVDGMGAWGIYTSFSEGAHIENNVASRSLKEHGIYFANSADRPVIRGNTVWGNRVCGIHMNGDANLGKPGIIKGALVENNVIYDNGQKGGSGINADGVQDSRFQNNLLYNNHSSGISLYRIDGGGPSKNNVVVNNTILVAADGRWAVNIKNGSTGNTVYNNILWNAHSSRGSINVSADSLPGLKSDYNIVADRFSPDDGENFIRLPKWRSLTGQDQHSFTAKPEALFRNPAAKDYRLAPGSPAIDTGTDRHAPTLDREGNRRPQGKGYDIGASEAPAKGD
jgi:parallel beta-helix repeat protein